MVKIALHMHCPAVVVLAVRQGGGEDCQKNVSVANAVCTVCDRSGQWRHPLSSWNSVGVDERTGGGWLFVSPFFWSFPTCFADVIPRDVRSGRKEAWSSPARTGRTGLIVSQAVARQRRAWRSLQQNSEQHMKIHLQVQLGTCVINL